MLAVRLAHAQPSLPADYGERVANLEQALNANPFDPSILDALAGSYAMGARYSEAIVLVRRLIAQNGDDLGLILRLAKLYAWAHDTDRSLDLLANSKLDNNVDAVAFKCDLLNAAGRSKEAAECFDLLARQATEHRELVAKALLGRAHNQLWSGNRVAAGHSFEEYLRFEPTDVTAAFGLR